MSAGDLNEVIDGLGWGKFQIINLFLLGILLMIDGMQMLLGSSIAGVLVKEYNQDEIWKGYLTSIVFVGLALGGFFSGPLGDGSGRRYTCIVAYILIMIFGLTCALANNLMLQMVSRLMMGIGAGIGVPAVVTMLVESSPTTVRSQILNASNFFFTAGELWACIGLMIFLPTLQGTTWREPALFGVMPAFLAFPFILIFLKESPRWLQQMGETDKLNELLKYAAVMNDKPDLDTHISDGIVAARSSGDEEGPGAMDRFSKLFSGDLLSTTLIGSYLCFLCNFMFYGQSYALAQQFQESKSWTTPAGELLIASAFEIPAVFIVMIMVNVEWIGHRDTISIFSLASCILSCALITMDYDITWVADPAAYLIKLSSTCLFMITYVYVPEAYPQRLRQTGVGFCISMGRVGSIVSPLIFEGLNKAFGKSHLPYLLISALTCIIGAWLAQELRVETKGMRLADETQEEIVEEMSKASSRWSNKQKQAGEAEHFKKK